MTISIFFSLGLPDPENESTHHSLPHRSGVSPSTAVAQQQQSGGGRSSHFDESQQQQQQHPHHQQQQQPNMVACLAALVCIIALFLPTEGDNTSDTIFQNYDYLHLTVNQKLVFAYVLGLVTISVLRMS